MGTRKTEIRAGKAYVQVGACRENHAWTVHTGFLPQILEPRRNALVVTDLYAASLNPDTKVADWVGYRVTAASQSGRNSLNRNWLHREKGWTLEAQDYEHSGYSMGHLCPLASVRADADAWQVNWTGIVAPQRQALNAGPWLDFEDFTRFSARMKSKVLVTCGPLFEHDMPELPNADEPHTVPSHFWARMYVPSADELTCWIMPQSAGRQDSHNEYLVSDDEVRRRSNLAFHQ